MRATILIGSIDAYGANRVLLQDVEALTDLGVDTRVCAPRDAILSDHQVERLASAGAKLEPFPLHVFRRVNLKRSMAPPLSLPPAARGADLVIAYTLAVAGYLPLLKLQGIPTVLSVHEIVEGVPGRTLGTLANFADQVVVNSRATAASLQWNGLSQAKQTTLMYPSVPNPRADLVQPRDATKLRVLLAGRVNGAKGHADAIRAVREARSNGIPAELTLAGGPFPGQEQWLARLRREAGSDPAIRYEGDVPHIGKLLARSNLLLIASRRPESFGYVALEAWSAGRRAIAPAEGGALEAMWLVDGLTFEPRNHASLAAQLNRIWERPDLLKHPKRSAPVAERCSPERRREAWSGLLDGHPTIAPRTPPGKPRATGAPR